MVVLRVGRLNWFGMSKDLVCLWSLGLVLRRIDKIGLEFQVDGRLVGLILVVIVIYV